MFFIFAGLIVGLNVFTFTLHSRRAWSLRELGLKARIDLIGWRLLDLVLVLGMLFLLVMGRLEAGIVFFVASVSYSFVVLPRVINRTVVEGVAEGAQKEEEKP